MALKRKRGRPIRGNVKRDKNISIRMTQNEYDYIHKKAEEEGMSMTDFLITAVLFYKK